jgi:hypothetical protein
VRSFAGPKTAIPDGIGVFSAGSAGQLAVHGIGCVGEAGEARSLELHLHVCVSGVVCVFALLAVASCAETGEGRSSLAPANSGSSSSSSSAGLIDARQAEYRLDCFSWVGRHYCAG